MAGEGGGSDVVAADMAALGRTGFVDEERFGLGIGFVLWWFICVLWIMWAHSITGPDRGLLN